MTSYPRRLAFISLGFLIVALTLLLQGADFSYAERGGSKTSPTSSSAPSRYPVIIRDIRSWSSKDLTRLVLDLSKAVNYEVKQSTPERTTVELRDAILRKSSRLRVSGGTIPRPFLISQNHPRTVHIVWPRLQLKEYKVFALTNPDRLVVEAHHRPQEQVRQARDIGSAQTRQVPAPTPPPIPAPTVTDSPVQALKPSGPVQTIVIDPGHGGKDPGTIGRHGTTEKDVTLQVGLLLKDLLAKRPNTRVLMTRERDVFIELEDRAKFANSQNADLFVSIHVNSHPHKTVKGLEIYHFGEAKDQRALEVAARENGTPLNSTAIGWEYLVADLLTSKKIERSLELAWTAKQAMVTRLNGRYSTIDHGVKTAPFYVLRFTTMPSILAEIAFMSNPAEEQQMRTPAFLLHLAESIADGIQAYLQPNRLAVR